ncbi:uncharacterized protein LOC132394451 isoform X2 [Hypanus sabinus]|uniref:uncharacterized protein LOC132394451 isoform X2 n=1 Tax=Hypanus sabinus TaxID=79690 RepID=UPI0028C38FF9|nr:uncharacterized protein LOC132394451 isoform X2 [Hypanus sabinus]
MLILQHFFQGYWSVSAENDRCPGSPSQLPAGVGMLFFVLSALPCLVGVFDADGAREVFGVMGSSVLLHPNVTIDPDKNEILWMFITGNKSAATLVHHIPSYPTEISEGLQFNSSNGSLVINRSEPENQGIYILTVDRRELERIRLLLFVKLSGAFISANSSSLGSDIQLICNVSGDHPEYRWWKDRREISWHHWLMDGNSTLIIPGASEYDCGKYTCVVSNPVSSIQAIRSLTFPGFPLDEITIATLSITDLVISSVCLTVFLSLHCWMMESGKAKKNLELWLLGLNVADLAPLIVIFIAVLNWIRIKGADPVPVAASCIVFTQFLDLSFIIQKLWYLCFKCFAKKTGVLDWAVCGLLVIVIVISLTFLIVIHQNYPGCDSSLITWRIFFTTRIGHAVSFILYFVVPDCSDKGRSENGSTVEGAQQVPSYQ